MLRSLLAETGAQAIFAEEDFTPYARKRDAQVARDLPLELISGQTVHHPATILKPDDKPYTVYTPYSKTWKAHLGKIELIPAPETIPTPAGIASEPLPAFSVSPPFPAGEKEALVRLERFCDGLQRLPTLEPKSGDFGVRSAIYDYSKNRNRMDLDGTSMLSPYLRFGMLGLRQAVHNAQQAIRQERSGGAETWLNELIWREFYIQILYHFPYVSQRAFNPALTNIPWRNDASEFEAWKAGRTGYPIVDAGMRQLKETGWMHNRARMIAASFLVKDLLIDWRWGEAWFMQNLLDGDPAANNGGWQWTAGTGTDAAPYFRIFNPVLQSRKFDPTRRLHPHLGARAARAGRERNPCAVGEGHPGGSLPRNTNRGPFHRQGQDAGSVSHGKRIEHSNKMTQSISPELGREAMRALLQEGSPLGPLKVMAKYVGRFFQIPLPGFKPYVVFGPEANRKVLVTERDKVLWRNHDPVTDLLQNGVLVTDGEEHDHYRKLMEPSSASIAT